MFIIKRKRNKKGEGVMSMPFAIIFSIILIVVFIVIAFVAIKNFLDIGKCGGVGTFYEDLQDKVNEAFASTGYKDWTDISLPSGITEVCFADLSKPQRGRFKLEYEDFDRFESYEANTFLYPANQACNMEYRQINHLDLNKIIETQNPYCISAEKKIEVIFEMYGKGVILKEK
jgi:hypothetical protein